MSEKDWSYDEEAVGRSLATEMILGILLTHICLMRSGLMKTKLDDEVQHLRDVIDQATTIGLAAEVTQERAAGFHRSIESTLGFMSAARTG